MTRVRLAGWPRWLRYTALGTGVALMVAGVGLVGWRVLRPAAGIDRPGKVYPERQVAVPKRYGTLPEAPLIVDSRLRVYAEKRRLWADAPATAKSFRTPYWSYRRWPGQLTGVVAVESTQAAPMVLGKWDDGTVVAVDARAGQVAWERQIARPDAAGYTGRRTGAAAVYEPADIYSAAGPDGRPVLVVRGRGTTAGYDPWTGAERWRRAAACARSVDWTGETTYVTACGDRIDIVDAATGRDVGSWSGAAPRPWGCGVGRSGCRMIHGGGTNFRLAPDGSVTPAPAARSAQGFVTADGYVEWQADSYVGAVDPATGAFRWRTPCNGYVVGADSNGVYVVTRDYRLLRLDPATGAERAQVPVRASQDWRAAHVHIRAGFVVIERVVGRSEAGDDAYYLGSNPVVLLGT